MSAGERASKASSVSKRMIEWKGEWPSTLRVDFIYHMPSTQVGQGAREMTVECGAEERSELVEGRKWTPWRRKIGYMSRDRMGSIHSIYRHNLLCGASE